MMKKITLILYLLVSVLLYGCTVPNDEDSKSQVSTESELSMEESNVISENSPIDKSDDENSKSQVSTESELSMEESNVISENSPIDKSDDIEASKGETSMDNNNSLNSNTNNNIRYETGIYTDKNWNDSIGTYDGVVIPNEKIALAIAETIFSGVPKNDEMRDFVPQTIFFDTCDEIWIISFGKTIDENSDIVTVGLDWNIAIQKSDGKILRIWVGE